MLFSVAILSKTDSRYKETDMARRVLIEFSFSLPVEREELGMTRS